jgi:hypothetical protein
VGDARAPIAPPVELEMSGVTPDGPGMTGGVQSPVVQQGARDLKRGLQDTSRAPEAEAAYRKLKK